MATSLICSKTTPDEASSHHKIVDVYLSKRRDRAAAEAFFETAIGSSTITPRQVMSDKAKCYPPALRAVLSHVEHRTSTYLNNGLERNQQHLKGRIRPMRWFKTTGGASNFCHVQTLNRNLGCGVSSLTARVSARLRLATAWSALAAHL